jgi:2-keto-3-deoxy-L-rhamnonate aldolase RhmA
MRNMLKEKLKAGKATVGGWVGIGHPDVAEMFCNVGFDWIVIDMEHGPLGIDTVEKMMCATNGTETVPLIRIAWNDPVLAKQALDTGAYGLVIPWVNTRQEAVNAVRACKYAPEGIRGVSPRRASKYYSEVMDYLKTANDEIMVVVQIETAEAVKNIKDIISVSGVDATFIGPMDLSVSMGYMSALPQIHPKVQGAIESVLKAHKGTSVTPGIYAGSVENVNKYIAMGFKILALGEDVDYLNIARDQLKLIKR